MKIFDYPLIIYHYLSIVYKLFLIYRIFILALACLHDSEICTYSRTIHVRILCPLWAPLLPTYFSQLLFSPVHWIKSLDTPKIFLARCARSYGKSLYTGPAEAVRLSIGQANSLTAITSLIKPVKPWPDHFRTASAGPDTLILIRGITQIKYCIIWLMQNAWQKNTIMLFIFIKVDIKQINHFGKDKTLNYIDSTGNPCTLE